MDNILKNNYSDILIEELQPALGCTEPIALAYAAALLKKTLGAVPDFVKIDVSGNIAKNVKSVSIPNSNGMIGIAAAVFLGIHGGDSDRVLEVLEDVKPEDIEAAKTDIARGNYKISTLNEIEGLCIELTGTKGPDEAFIKIDKSHTNITKLIKNGVVIISKECDETSCEEDLRKKLSVHEILEYAKQPLDEKVVQTIETMIKCNDEISKEGLKNQWGVNIGAYLYNKSDVVDIRAAARAAAGSDARMTGCTLPVVINSGSGNQGLTVSLPVMEYAEYYKKTHEELIRALIVSNLLSVRIKYGMGKLSAFCGAVSAAAAAGAGIAFLMNESEDVINLTLINSLGNVAGLVCDGAKASCATKIASSVQAAIFGYELAVAGRSFRGGEGLVADDIETTIDNYARLGLEGMHETDKVILDIMVNGC